MTYLSCSCSCRMAAAATGWAAEPGPGVGLGLGFGLGFGSGGFVGAAAPPRPGRVASPAQLRYGIRRARTLKRTAGGIPPLAAAVRAAACAGRGSPC